MKLFMKYVFCHYFIITYYNIIQYRSDVHNATKLSVVTNTLEVLLPCRDHEKNLKQIYFTISLMIMYCMLYYSQMCCKL